MRIRRHRGRHIFVVVTVLLVAVIAAYGYYSYKMPLPALAAQPSNIKPENAFDAKLPWPAYGASAVGAVGYGVLDTNSNDKQIPTASIAKTMAALAVLHKKPLKIGDQGPTITMTKTDVGYYDTYFDEGGSLVPVSAGEKITEYQAIEAMMLPSANNMAKSLAGWAYGSESNYVTYANDFAKQLGMDSSHFADASGFNPKTVSTAHDLILLGIAAEKNPVLAQIVSQKSAKLPVAGTVHNVNWLLNYPPFDGIKTGSTDSDPGAVLFSEPKTYPNGQTITLVGVIMGARTLNIATNDSFPLMKSAEQKFQATTLIVGGQVVGRYAVPWDPDVEAVAAKPLVVMTWQGRKIQPDIALKKLQAPSAKGTVVGKITAGMLPGKSVAIITKRATSEPGWTWRAFRNL